MRSFTRFSKGLFTAGVLAGSLLGMGACGPNYALFRVDVSSGTSPRNQIEECRMTITDENGVVVMNNLPLKTIQGPQDSSGNATLIQGCQGGITNPNIGTFSYSSSRTSGTLTFRVDALDNKQNVIQTGSGVGSPAPFPPEVQVTVIIK
jgi:hypothetical protein